MAQTTQKTHVTCQTASSLVFYQDWAWRGRHRKHSLIYCSLLDRVYRAVAWQSVDRGKTIPVTGHGGPEVCETLRSQRFVDNRLTHGSEVVSLMCRPPFIPRNYLETFHFAHIAYSSHNRRPFFN
jgi:hypothetical protein